ncbi:MAG TPA: pyridoxamine 5'-phosphate oxidase family protein [Casimicrobiaceae bacterium]
MTTRSHAIREVEKLIRDVKTAMLTTRSGDGRLVSRPIATRQREFDGELWFLTAMDSKKVHELLADPRVNIAYVNEADAEYVSIDGRATVVRDTKKIEEMWTMFDDVWFPKGKRDPNVVALQVTVDTAETWTSSTSAIGRVFDFLRAKVTGDSTAMGEQRHFELQEPAPRH